MKLSDAIRAGVQRRPKAVGNFFVEDAAGTLCSCALGAAYEAMTGVAVPANNPVVLADLDTFFPELLTVVTLSGDGRSRELFHIIVFLNDRQGWSREQIADWLQSIGY